ncbi:uncharacterized protein MEPE_06693 [Melanopsichium pennsylvanicum]|uniref:Uncharacterized protein n=2 Tax=Melanopsichium pennsylvanicum TaxID=63383 RepID=A0AAJ4XT54_9BASI|nr:uncharacterized protein BN887_02842 [Melanopsichium pennsylvanicum 4]SNX87982.1 uncharacterized protein MEPE_06693 [Melanopsichium pennsylvanicum]
MRNSFALIFGLIFLWATLITAAPFRGVGLGALENSAEALEESTGSITDRLGRMNLGQQNAVPSNAYRRPPAFNSQPRPLQPARSFSGSNLRIEIENSRRPPAVSPNNVPETSGQGPRLQRSEGWDRRRWEQAIRNHEEEMNHSAEW